MVSALDTPMASVFNTNGRGEHPNQSSIKNNNDGLLSDDTDDFDFGDIE